MAKDKDIAWLMYGLLETFLGRHVLSAERQAEHGASNEPKKKPQKRGVSVRHRQKQSAQSQTERQ